MEPGVTPSSSAAASRGCRPPWLPLLHWYTDNLMQTVTTHKEVCFQFYLTAAMLADLRALLRPGVLSPVLGCALRNLIGAARAPEQATTLPQPTD